VPLSQTIRSAIPNTRQQDMVRPERDLYPSSADPAGMKRSGFLGIDENDNAPVWKAEFYEGLRQQSMGNMSTAQVHFDNAVDAGFFENIGDNAEFFSYLFTFQQPVDTAPAGTSFISTTTTNNVVAEKLDRLVQVGQKVIQYKDPALANNSTIQDRIAFSTWQLLFAELATINPEFGQFSNARWCFVEGSKAIKLLEADLKKAPDELAAMTSNPDGQALVMRLDAVQVRFVAIQDRLTINYEQERQRLNRLREIVKTYKSLTASLVNTNSNSMIGNHDLSLSEAQSAMEAVVELRKLAETANEQYDFYLFSDEPKLQEITKPGDFEIVNIPKTVFANDLVADLKSFVSQTFYRKALESPEGLQETKLLLDQAIKYANSAVAPQKNIEGLPAGFDASSPLALYALTASLHELSRQSTVTNPASTDFRIDALALQKTATDTLSQLSPEIESIADLAPPLKNSYETLQHELRGSKPLLDDVQVHLMSGGLAEAGAVADLAMQLYSEESTWVAWLNAHRRLGKTDLNQKLSLFSAAIDNRLINQKNPQILIAQSMAEITVVLQDLAATLDAKGDPATVDITDITALRELASEMSVQLLAGPNKTLWGKVQAIQTALVATELLIIGKDVSDEMIVSAYEAGLNARTQCIDSVDRTPEDIIAQECLVACLRGLGHLGSHVLKDYMDDPIAYFTHANDAEAALPFSVKSPIHTGTPLLGLVNTRSEDDKANQLNNERRTRHMIQGMLDSAYVLNFGDPMGAAASATKAAEVYGMERDKAEAGDSFIAEDYADIVDGFDAEITTYQSALSFKALAYLAANDPQQGLQSALIIDGTTSEIDITNIADEMLIKKVEQAQSPLVAYTLAAALESYAVTLDYPERMYRARLISTSLQLYTKANNLMDILRIKEKYSHLTNLVTGGITRLEDPSATIKELELASNTGVPFPIFEMEQMVRRHPDNSYLWSMLLDRQIKEARISRSAELFSKILEYLSLRRQLISPFVYHYYRGVCYQNLEQNIVAQTEFDLAVESAANDEEKVLALSSSARNNVLITNP
jgi:tetratricopeptide (TPR) repeat protein